MTIIFATATAAGLLMSAAVAEEATGTVTQINRLNSTIAIRQTQSGTVGANGGGGGASQEFKVQDGQLLDNLHAGDRVNFSVNDNNGVKTVTKLQRQ
jgi:Cu/Ag efflux protein CusF